MTYEQYWDGDPYLVVAYRRLNDLRIEQRNQEMWVLGGYIFNAVDVAVYNNLRTKGKPRTYIDKPIRLTEMDEIEKEAERERAKQQLREYLTSLGRSAHNKQTERRGK